MTASLRFSLHAQAIAQALGETLQEICGEPVVFMLVVQADKVAQYVANGDRRDCQKLLEELLERWKANRADIPAHYNPDLKGEL